MLFSNVTMSRIWLLVCKTVWSHCKIFRWSGKDWPLAETSFISEVMFAIQRFVAIMIAVVSWYDPSVHTKVSQSVSQGSNNSINYSSCPVCLQWAQGAKQTDPICCANSDCHNFGKYLDPQAGLGSEPNSLISLQQHAAITGWISRCSHAAAELYYNACDSGLRVTTCSRLRLVLQFLGAQRNCC